MANEVRDTLFGDMEMAAWPEGEAETEPWTSFVEARRVWGEGDRATATYIWQRILDTPSLETRHYLQAWHFLRQAGASPSDTDAKQLLGVVLEVSLEAGLDLLAAYDDGTARYYNPSGAGVIWERPDERLDPEVNALLSVGREVVSQIGPWDGARPDAQGPGHIRLNFLTPAGLHFGQAPLDAMGADPTGGPVVSAGLALMQALVGLAPDA